MPGRLLSRAGGVAAHLSARTRKRVRRVNKRARKLTARWRKRVRVIRRRGGGRIGALRLPLERAYYALRPGVLPERDLGPPVEVVPPLFVEGPASPERMTEWRLAALDRLPDELLRRGNYDVASRLLASDYVLHDLPSGRDVRGQGGYKEYVIVLRHAFPDLRIDVEDQVVDGDEVRTRYTAHATFAGAYRGTPPTGNRIAVSGELVSTFSGIRLSEEWNDYDREGMRRQMLDPAPAPTTAEP